MNIKAIMPICAAGLLTLTACSDVKKRAKDYLSENNHTLRTYNEVISADNIQSKLDSVAYRDVFNSTKASKDSTLDAEFNKITTKMRGTGSGWERWVDINKRLENEGIKLKDFDKIDLTDTSIDDGVRINKRQHYADDWAYRKFFTKIGIMNDSIAKICDNISIKIRP